MKFSLKNKFDELVYSLNVKYNIFYNNHEYKNSHFQNEEDYLNIQKKLSEEIQICENDMKDLITIFANELYSNIKIVAYDSRSICVVENKENVGHLLVSNICKDDANNLKNKFKEYFEFNINIDLFEDLPDSLKNKFTF